MGFETETFLSEAGTMLPEVGTMGFEIENLLSETRMMEFEIAMILP
ncbi:hypothetical protein GS601_02345 [Myxacorys almedinensis A]|uniref:Uncharacterized protein n=1 Tax=Myxacorys almedinensis A TaxID=2690445 RepID=A0A8J7Z1M5_9CYAN|nr:hypothetical protein [Myxacorys almedinensis A]